MSAQNCRSSLMVSVQRSCDKAEGMTVYYSRAKDLQMVAGKQWGFSIAIKSDKGGCGVPWRWFPPLRSRICWRCWWGC